MVSGIFCRYKEFRLKDGKWHPTDESVFQVSLNTILTTIEATVYHKCETYVSYKNNRRWGLVPVSYTVTSECGAIRRIYKFNYDRSFEYETE